jgi:hypothetical protein
MVIKITVQEQQRRSEKARLKAYRARKQRKANDKKNNSSKRIAPS